MKHPEHFSGEVQTSWDLLKKAEVKALCATAFPVPDDGNWHDPALTNQIEAEFLEYLAYAEANQNWNVIKTREDLRRCFSGDVSGLLLHIEGLNSFSGTVAEWQQLERWYEIGWRSLGIVWNKSNALGGGTEDHEAGLSPLGVEILDFCVQKGISLDCAHMNAPTFNAAASVIESNNKPIVVSHGNAATISPHQRNYTDEQILRIAKSGGVIGLFFADAFTVSDIKERCTIDSVVAHAKHIKKIAGSTCLAIGTDFGGITKGVPQGLESINKIAHLYDALSQAGFGSQEIEEIASGNAVRAVGAYLQ